MLTRTRAQDKRSLQSGSYWNKNAAPQTVTQSRLAGKWGTCDDTIGHFEIRGTRVKKKFYLPNACQIVTFETKLPSVNGTKKSLVDGSKVKELTSWPLEHNPNPMDSSVPFPTLNNLERNNLSWETLAKTNPSAPNISVPAFVGELKDVPGLIKDWGGSLLRKMAKGHLSWRWGIKPMIKDIQTMLDFSKHVDKRVKKLEHIRDTGVLRSRCSLSSSSIPAATHGQYVNSYAAVIWGVSSTTYTSKVWGSVERKLSPGTVLPKDGEGMRILASQLVLGITSYELLAAAWELLPWSWFIDWFSNVGTVITACNNTIGLTWQNLCIMQETTSSTTWSIDMKPPSDNWVTVDGPFSQKETRKKRTVGNVPTAPVAPTLQPLVEGKTWSILGSIAVLRRK